MNESWAVDSVFDDVNSAFGDVNDTAEGQSRDESAGYVSAPHHKARALIADDHILVAEACKRLLEPEFDVIGIVADGRAMVRANSLLKPDVIISDVGMRLLNGLDAGEQCKAASPEVRLVFLTMIPDPELAAEAFRRGASGYLLKTSAAGELTAAVREVLSGR